MEIAFLHGITANCELYVVKNRFEVVKTEIVEFGFAEQ